MPYHASPVTHRKSIEEKGFEKVEIFCFEEFSFAKRWNNADYDIYEIVGTPHEQYQEGCFELDEPDQLVIVFRPEDITSYKLIYRGSEYYKCEGCMYCGFPWQLENE